jgi:hypothetical protein
LKKGALVKVLPRRPLRTDWFRLFSRNGDERAPLFARLARLLRARPLT